MFGWLFDAFEKYVVFRYGELLLSNVLSLLKSHPRVEHEWVINRDYPDSLFVELLSATCNVVKHKDRNQTLMEFGEYFFDNLR
jgi:hypothetical protein